MGHCWAPASLCLNPLPCPWVLWLMGEFSFLPGPPARGPPFPTGVCWGGENVLGVGSGCGEATPLADLLHFLAQGCSQEGSEHLWPQRIIPNEPLFSPSPGVGLWEQSATRGASTLAFPRWFPFTHRRLFPLQGFIRFLCGRGASGWLKGGEEESLETWLVSASSGMSFGRLEIVASLRLGGFLSLSTGHAAFSVLLGHKP